MSKMKAIVKNSLKENDFRLMEVPVPQINDHEMLVRIKAIGVGIHDSYFLPKDIRFPYPIGIEASGIIEEVGKNISTYTAGDEIAFVSSMQAKGGTWAEFAVVADHSLILPIPEGMSFTEAAAIPVAGNTALKALHSLELKPADTLFIAGASGAIGTFAIQLAVDKGFIVAGSASKKNHDYMCSLGASKVVDYHDTDWTEQIKEWMPQGVDAVMATQPGTAFSCINIVKNGGNIIPISGDQFNSQNQVIIKQLAYHLDVNKELMELMNQITKNQFKLYIEQLYPFEKGLDALQKVAARHTRGKLVITMP